jgi:hypothetical protein
LSSATNALFANANGGIFATAADALAFSLLLMTQVEGHRSFDLRIFVDCSVPRSTHRSSFRRTLLRWRRREFRLLRRWKGGESVALPYHRGRPVDRDGACFWIVACVRVQSAANICTAAYGSVLFNPAQRGGYNGGLQWPLHQKVNKYGLVSTWVADPARFELTTSAFGAA